MNQAIVSAGEFAFNLGQLVSHRDQPMLSTVLHRQRATNGMEIYGVRRLVDRSPVPYLMMLGEVLIPVAVEDAEAVASAEEVWFDKGEALHAPLPA